MMTTHRGDVASGAKSANNDKDKMAHGSNSNSGDALKEDDKKNWEKEDDEDDELQRALALSLMATEVSPSSSSASDKQGWNSTLSSWTAPATSMPNESMADLRGPSNILDRTVRSSSERSSAFVSPLENALLTPPVSTFLTPPVSTFLTPPVATFLTPPVTAFSTPPVCTLLASTKTPNLESVAQFTPFAEADVTDFHRLMWDPTLTTESDQSRWISQGIDVRSDQKLSLKVQASRTLLDELAASHLPWGLVQEHGGPCGVLAAVQAELLRVLLFDTEDNPLLALHEDTHSSQQQSNIQANPQQLQEVQHLQEPNPQQLLQSQKLQQPDTQQSQQIQHSYTQQSQQLQQSQQSQQPQQPNTQQSQHQNERNQHSPHGDLLSPDRIHTALAGAIATVLARAALTPSAVTSGDDGATITNATTANVPNITLSNAFTKKTSNVVQVILPNHPIDDAKSQALTRDDLQPWPLLANIGEDDATTAAVIRESMLMSVPSFLQTLPTAAEYHNKLHVYKIAAEPAPFAAVEAKPVSSIATSAITSNTSKNVAPSQTFSIPTSLEDCPSPVAITDNQQGQLISGDDNSSAAKRQKMVSKLIQNTNGTNNTFSIYQDSEHDASSQLSLQIFQLTKQVQSFLLQPLHQSSTSTLTSISTSEKSLVTRPLDYFRNHGGVLLLVMSVVASRGVSIVQSEFDDPVGSKLTSNFGHCSQELINLLLTGQAVSNVFDNTLTPSGLGMVCRGIQSRPYIGYLSQLEAMRYCEVGTYYKSPRVPIWVVGSTSHFTVLFGDRQALKESPSDLLLEQCRRAFKGVEGGEENGFIATNQLSTVFRKLNIQRDVKDSKTIINLDDAKIQTLAAALEVTGAGIILWDDFWKAASRLLTGATFESVIVMHANGGIGMTSTSYDDISDTIPQVATAPSPNDSNYNNCPNFTNYNTFANFAATEGSGNASSTLNRDSKQRTNSPLIQSMDDITGFASLPPGVVESDEEMARRLTREWEQESSTTTATTMTTNTASCASTSAPATTVIAGTASPAPSTHFPLNTSATSQSAVGMSVLTEAIARVGSPMEIEPNNASASTASRPTNNDAGNTMTTMMTIMMSDEELARKLQAEWDSELSAAGGGGATDTSSVVALRGSPVHDNQSNNRPLFGEEYMDDDCYDDAVICVNHGQDPPPDALNMGNNNPYISKNSSTPPRLIFGGLSNGTANSSTTHMNVNMTTVVEEDGDFDVVAVDNDDEQDACKPSARASYKYGPLINYNNHNTNDDNYNMNTSTALAGALGVTTAAGLEFERYGETFTLYHYNGLQGGMLTSFQITRLTAEEAVGSSIALNRSHVHTATANSTSSNGAILSTSGSHPTSSILDNCTTTNINVAQDLEDIVRTKWPSCAIHWNYLNHHLSSS